MTAYLKWTGPGRKPALQGGKPIPVGVWTATVEHPVLCRSGWHACRWEDVPAHVADELWVCDLDGLIVEGGDKVVASRLRLVEQVPVSDRVFRLWAADCAEQVLPIFLAKFPNDDRPRNTIEAARLFADGAVTAKELAAARAAAWAAAGDAAWAAGGAARAARGAAGAAGDAAWAAGGAAGAAGDAAGAAWGAARAARDATGAVWDAAGTAAWAAGTAAWAAGGAAWAAGDAAWAWQADRLLDHHLGLNPALFAHRVTA